MAKGKVEQKIDLIKTVNPTLQKIHKYRGELNFFENKFEIYSRDTDVSSSYIFDNLNDAYELKKLLGKGAFGIVKKGKILKTGAKVAVKIQNITGLIEYHFKTIGDIEQARDYVESQIEVEDALLKLTGQHISSIRRKNLKNQEKHYSIMKYIEGDQLKNIFSDLSFQEKIQVFIELTRQVQFLHDNNYLHLDIWRENILFNGQAILHDYGCSAKLLNGTFVSKLKGSHIPPEIIESQKKLVPCMYGKFSDVYALGMTFYELIYEDYYDYTLDKTFDDFIKRYTAYYMAVVDVLNSKEDLLAQLITKMITPNISQRILVIDILSGLNLIKEKFNPEVNATHKSTL
ncbi:protein kinase domain-containing protein [Legionella cardiaca]|uniref:Protein kinase n=1 Tax=Legionella cardiaca TaxID=1071983 RepID=A0ABY8ASW3_9GAMM|nr:protein kinase [Legionella cardiaca]WED42595.1 protein kinase [Legionella cardiaca]